MAQIITPLLPIQKKNFDKTSIKPITQKEINSTDEEKIMSARNKNMKNVLKETLDKQQQYDKELSEMEARQKKTTNQFDKKYIEGKFLPKSLFLYEDDEIDADGVRRKRQENERPKEQKPYNFIDEITKQQNIEINKTIVANNQAVFSEIDTFNNHFFINRYKLLLPKILNNLNKNAEFRDAINPKYSYQKKDNFPYIDNFFTYESLNYYYFVIQQCDQEKARIYRSLLYKISNNNGPVYLSLLSQNNNQFLFEKAPSICYEMKNPLLFILITDHLNIMILSMLNFIYENKFVLEGFKIYLINLTNPIQELRIKFGDIIFKLEYVSIVPLFILDPNFYVKKNATNFEMLASYNNLVRFYFVNNFDSGKFPISNDNNLNINPSIMIKNFLLKHFSNYHDLSLFSSVKDNSLQVVSSLIEFSKGSAYKNQSNEMIVVLDTDDFNINFYYLLNMKTGIIYNSSLNDLTKLFKQPTQGRPTQQKNILKYYEHYMNV